MDASNRRKRAAEEAAEWWVLLQGEVSRGEREQYVDWLRESAVHVAEMLRVAQVHGALAQFKRWADIPTGGSGEAPANVVALPPSHDQPSSPPEPSKHSTLRLRWAYSLAASVLLVAGLTAWILLADRGHIIQTERGERREVALTDGSVVEVDPETRLRVGFEEHTRRVFLERGRALFRVAKNPNREFLVQADGTTVRAVGTAFGVERQKQGVVVTVAEGRVAVFATESASVAEETPNAGEAASAAEGEGTASTQPRSPTTAPRMHAHTQLFLTAGQQVTMESSGTAEPVRKVDSDRELAWAQGRLVFDNETVANAIAQFNRYNRVQLHVTDDALAKRPMSAVFDASDPESFIAFLQTVASVRVTRSDPADIIIATAK